MIDLFSIDLNEKEYLFISDTLNHCIKRIDLQDEITDVIAGICG